MDITTPIIKITEAGIEVTPFVEFREALAEIWRAIFKVGENELNTDPDTPDGHHIDVESKILISVAYALQGIAENLYLDSAAGVWLDHLAALFNIEREPGETDAELRVRIKSVFTGGYATFDGMLGYLRKEISGAVVMAVNEEPTESTAGLPPHSITIYVPKGDDTEAERNAIAKAIFTCKPAGIRTFGTETGTAEDSSGGLHDIAFNYITAGNCEVNLTVTVYDEETLPENPAEAIKTAITTWAAREYTDGKDIFPQRILTPVYTVPGIGACEISCTYNGETSETHIAVPLGQYVMIGAEGITINGLPE